MRIVRVLPTQILPPHRAGISPLCASKLGAYVMLYPPPVGVGLAYANREHKVNLAHANVTPLTVPVFIFFAPASLSSLAPASLAPTMFNLLSRRP